MKKPQAPAKKTDPPEQEKMLGDLTPEYIRWHRENHTPEEHAKQYLDRIPHDYAERFGIERV
jgi:hypothetical protein